MFPPSVDHVIKLEGGPFDGHIVPYEGGPVAHMNCITLLDSTCDPLAISYARITYLTEERCDVSGFRWFGVWDGNYPEGVK